MYRYTNNIFSLVIAFGISFFVPPVFTANAQTVNDHKYNVLFLGNSYTYVNNLPLVTASAAASVGDSLVYDSNTIGGYTLEQHSQDATSLSKIAVGNWDYVVLQEQSQLPSFPIEQVDTQVFPYAKILDSTIHHDNSCGRTMFYMTWGREYGDTSNCPTWPPVCTYQGMDSMLYLRYMMMADSNNAVVSPVGAVRRYIIDNYPSIQLYQADQSHPTPAGTYAAACCFYTAIFKRDPTLITYNFSLADTDAAHIRTAAKVIVYDSLLKWHIGQYSPVASASYSVTGTQVTFANTSTNATTYTWSFGDGQTSTLSGPVHNYGGMGIYTVTMVAINCGKSDTAFMTVNLFPAGIVGQFTAADNFVVFPNPAYGSLYISSPVFSGQSYEIHISNLLGQMVFAATSNLSRNQEIDISGLSKGLYLISVMERGQVLFRSKFLKN